MQENGIGPGEIGFEFRIGAALGERRRFRDYAKDALVSAACFQAGFMLAYNTNIIFK